MQKLPVCAQYAVAAFAPVNAGAGTVGESSELSRAIDTLIGSGKPLALVALGESVPVASLPEGNRVSGNVQHGSAVGDRGGEGVVGGDRDSRPSAGHDSGAKRDMAKEYNCRLPTGQQLVLTKNSCTHRALFFHTRRVMFSLPSPGAEVLLLLVVLGAAVYDVRYRRIPNWLSMSGVLAGIAMNTFLYQGWPGLPDCGSRCKAWHWASPSTLCCTRCALWARAT